MRLHGSIIVLSLLRQSHQGDPLGPLLFTINLCFVPCNQELNRGNLDSAGSSPSPHKKTGQLGVQCSNAFVVF